MEIVFIILGIAFVVCFFFLLVNEHHKRTTALESKIEALENAVA
jgi:preprotein translocase subunit YajC